VDGAAVDGEGRFLHRLAQGRVGVAGAGDVLGRSAELDRQCRFGNHRAGVGADDVAAEHLIGLGVGAALGLLLAPKSGRQLRRDLRRSYDGALDTVSDWTDEAKDRFEEAVEKGADFADELRAKAEPLSDLLRRP